MRGILKRFYFSGGIAQQIIDYFRTRILGLGGITEATTCAEGTLNAINNANLLQQATFVMAASGYKSGVIYPQVPNSNSNGDLTFTRSSTATRVNSSGQIESVASGVPSLDYSQGTCPTFLFEPQRTNNVRNSECVGASTSPSTAPTYWNLPSGSGVTSTVVGAGTLSDGAKYVDLRIQRSGTGNTFIDVYCDSGLTPAVLGNIVNVSAMLSLVGGSLSGVSSLNFQTNEYDVDTLYLATLIGQNLTLTSTHTSFNTSFTITNGARPTAKIYAHKFTFSLTSTTAPIDLTIRVSKPMCETAPSNKTSYPTSYIPTTGATATRTASSFTRNNVYTNGLISASGGTWFVELNNNLSIKGAISSSIYGLYIGDSSSAPSNAISIQNDNTTNRIKIATIASGTPTNRYTTSAASVKLAIVFNGSTLSVFENGVKQVNGIAFTPTISGYENFCDVNTDVSKFIRSMALWSTPLSDIQCIALTTP